MISIGIVEDDRYYQQLLKSYLERLEGEISETFQIRTFSSGSEIAYSYTADFQILLMDIEMGELSGMEAAKLIRKADRNVVILFITNSPQYAIQGYEVEALDYVLKPVSYYSFAEKLKRAIARMERRTKQYIKVSAGRGEVKKLDISEITYVEVLEHTLIYHTTGGEIRTGGSMKEVEAQLEGKGFFRCNKGFLVNLEHVEGIRGDYVIAGGDAVPVSRPKKKALLDAVNNYISEVGK